MPARWIRNEDLQDEVLRMFKDGYSYQQIASELGPGIDTDMVRATLIILGER